MPWTAIRPGTNRGHEREIADFGFPGLDDGVLISGGQHSESSGPGEGEHGNYACVEGLVLMRADSDGGRSVARPGDLVEFIIRAHALHRQP